MNLSEFVAGIKTGTLTVRSGSRSGNRLIETMSILGIEDIDAITAEAYGQDVLSNDLPWEEGRKQIVKSLDTVEAERHNQGTPNDTRVTQ